MTGVLIKRGHWEMDEHHGEHCVNMPTARAAEQGCEDMPCGHNSFTVMPGVPADSAAGREHTRCAKERCCDSCKMEKAKYLNQ